MLTQGAWPPMGSRPTLGAGDTGSEPSPASPRAKTSGGLGVDVIRIDQDNLAIGHVSRPALDLGGPKGVGMGIVQGSQSATASPHRAWLDAATRWDLDAGGAPRILWEYYGRIALVEEIHAVGEPAEQGATQ